MNLVLPSQIIITTLGIGYLITLLLIIAYEHKQLSKRSKHIFLLAKFIQIIAWLGLAYREGSYGIYVVAFSNSLLFISYTLEVIAFLSLKNMIRPIEKRLLYVLMVLSIIGFNCIIIFNNIQELRIVFYSVVNVCMYLFMYRMVFSKGTTVLMRLIGILYLLFALASVIRAILTIASSFSTSYYAPGNFQWVFLLSVYIFSNLGTIGFILLMKEEVDRDLHYFANFDDLTSVLNRRSFAIETKNKLNYCAKKRKSVAYILFDVDHFKMINDTYGHFIGDKVLQTLTTNIKPYLQNDDLFGRYGGDEFALLLVDKNEQEAIDLIKQIQQSIQSISVKDKVVQYSISIGVVTTIPTNETNLELLYTSCDKALYVAKSGGRNIFVKGEFEQAGTEV